MVRKTRVRRGDDGFWGVRGVFEGRGSWHWLKIGGKGEDKGGRGINFVFVPLKKMKSKYDQS